MTKIKDAVCPHCGKKGTWTAENKFKPFCSERCKLIDLGGWADEQYRVPGDPVDPNKNQEDDEEK